jgi:hypothetical protein
MPRSHQRTMHVDCARTSMRASANVPHRLDARTSRANCEIRATVRAGVCVRHLSGEPDSDRQECWSLCVSVTFIVWRVGRHVRPSPSTAAPVASAPGAPAAVPISVPAVPPSVPVPAWVPGVRVPIPVPVARPRPRPRPRSVLARRANAAARATARAAATSLRSSAVSCAPFFMPATAAIRTRGLAVCSAAYVDAPHARRRTRAGSFSRRRSS